MLPITERMRPRYDSAVRSVQSLVDGVSPYRAVDPDSISELKGMFNRIVRQDRPDWMGVYLELGEPTLAQATTMAKGLADLRRTMVAGNKQDSAEVTKTLLADGLQSFLRAYQTGRSDWVDESLLQWAYVISADDRQTVEIGIRRQRFIERLRELESVSGRPVTQNRKRLIRVVSSDSDLNELVRVLQESRLRSQSDPLSRLWRWLSGRETRTENGVKAQVFRMTFQAAVALIEEFAAAERRRTRQQGRIQWFDAKKGYGFINLDRQDKVFFHASQIVGTDLSALIPGAVVGFDLGKGDRGSCAFGVRTIVSSSPPSV